jgi:putative methyltransferase (TIGR04325 family)
LRPRGTVWAGDYRSWSEALAASGSYDSDVIFRKVEAAAREVHEGRAVYERDGVVFDHIEYSWFLLSALLWVAARNGGKLDVLDFGGALGSTYRQNARFLKALEVRWNIVEQPRFVESGKKHFAGLHFYDSIDACLRDASPQVAVLSSVLQYLERPREILEQLGNIPFVVIDLTGVHAGPRDRLTVQTVPPEIYPASYPCWIFSEARLRQDLQRSHSIVAESDSHIGNHIRIGNLRAGYRGFILEKSR